MKKLLLAAAVAGSAALCVSTAYAIDVTVGGEGGVDVTIGAGSGEAEAGAAGEAAVGVDAGAGARDAGAMMEPPTEVTIQTEGGSEANVAADTLIDQAVFTNDGVEIGVVSAVTATMNGDTQFVVTLGEGWMEGVTSVAISASAVVQAENGLVVDTDEADLRASIEAGLAAAAE